jgi:Universal stress protein family
MRLVLVHVSHDGDVDVDAIPGAEDVRVVHGSRAEAIAEVAAEEGADLIVLGSRAGGLRRRLLRSGLARELEQVTGTGHSCARPRRAAVDPRAQRAPPGARRRGRPAVGGSRRAKRAAVAAGR